MDGLSKMEDRGTLVFAINCGIKVVDFEKTKVTYLSEIVFGVQNYTNHFFNMVNLCINLMSRNCMSMYNNRIAPTTISLFLI